ncbi:MAG TPA: C40 family peptidase [Micropepsaceae bacterium]|nr:C40 family peptidase [Micropepsaceae bacterium]
MDFDKRVTPARLDLAAAHLEGKIHAAKFVEGRTAQLTRGVAGLYGAPIDSSGLRTQLLFGESFTIYEDKLGWVWGQAALDGYVGFARADGFGAPVAATHRVIARGTPLLNAPDVKKGARDMLPMNAKIAVADMSERFARLTNGAYVFGGHIAPLDASAPDWVGVAEQFAGVPYVWGGKTAAGLDCSGLVQTALEAGGIKAPRDTDMIESAIGIAIAPDSELRRGDLIFWKGHVGVMLDAARLIHANGYFMQVSVEPLAEVRARTLASENLPVRTIKRL